MSSKFRQFRALHYEAEPLVIGNVWNVQSARLFEKMKFKAVATSSAAVAETLGYAEGHEMSFEEYLFIIRRIVTGVSIPVSVDLDTGFGETTEQIIENIKTLYQLGVAGINIEDSFICKGKRSLLEPMAFAKKLQAICNGLEESGIALFINARSDVFLLDLEDPLAAARERVETYAYTGIHGLFFPGMTNMGDISIITDLTILPINVMSMPELPHLKLLQYANVKRISTGHFLNRKAYQTLETEFDHIFNSGNFKSLFA